MHAASEALIECSFCGDARCTHADSVSKRGQTRSLKSPPFLGDPTLLDNPNMQLAQLFQRHGRGGLHHHILRLLVQRKRDDLANV